MNKHHPFFYTCLSCTRISGENLIGWARVTCPLALWLTGPPRMYTKQRRWHPIRQWGALVGGGIAPGSKISIQYSLHFWLIRESDFSWVRFLPSSDFHSLSSTTFTSSLKASVMPSNILAAKGCDFGPVLPSSGSQFPHLSHEGIYPVSANARRPGVLETKGRDPSSKGCSCLTCSKWKHCVSVKNLVKEKHLEKLFLH